MVYHSARSKKRSGLVVCCGVPSTLGLAWHTRIWSAVRNQSKCLHIADLHAPCLLRLACSPTPQKKHARAAITKAMKSSCVCFQGNPTARHKLSDRKAASGDSRQGAFKSAMRRHSDWLRTADQIRRHSSDWLRTSEARVCQASPSVDSGPRGQMEQVMYSHLP